MAPRPGVMAPVPERIASVIAGTGGDEVLLQLGEPPQNAGFPSTGCPVSRSRPDAGRARAAVDQYPRPVSALGRQLR